LDASFKSEIEEDDFESRNGGQNWNLFLLVSKAMLTSGRYDL